MSDNNNVSNGPIPFFSTGDKQSSFLSGTNITNSSTTSTQPAQPSQSSQSTQPSQQKTTTTTSSKQPVNDVSSLFGNNKEESFLSTFTTNTGTVNVNTTSNLPPSNNLFYNNGMYIH